MPLRAITLDYWDTMYTGAASPERMALRRAALRRLVTEVGGEVEEEHFAQLYQRSGAEAERWWREEQRGYRTGERIRWLLRELSIERPEQCEHVDRAARAVDDALLELPPELLPGVVAGVRRLGQRFALGIISDTGFASGDAQDRLLERDGLLEAFQVRLYSCDVGHAKPHPEPFARAAAALEVPPGEILHVGDMERTDVRGALAAGFRAVRIDAVRDSGPSEAEAVVRSWSALEQWVDSAHASHAQ